MTSTRPCEVLIAGAGPTGLVLALWLTRSGVRVRLIDKAPEPGATSRALVVHARTLELYRELGLADSVISRGLRFEAVNLWTGGRHVGHVAFGPIGQGLSRFPHMEIFPQDEHERLLIERLGEAGVEVERPVELIDGASGPDGMRVRLRKPDGSEETCQATYLAGCDGAHSKVREVNGVGFPGGTYAHVFYVADVDADGPLMNGELHVSLDESDFLGVFPLRGGRTARLIGTVRPEQETKDSLTWADVNPNVAQRLGIRVERVNWFSTYHVHHRVADRFRKDRVFLLGDAAHIHSPVGGQGMNTGIGDAANLAWKLADVLRGRAEASLLDSYEPERRAFAQRLVATTDKAFVVATGPGSLARVVRTRIVPWLLPPLARLRAVRRLMFRTLSQTAIHYRGSPLSEGRAGSVHAGDRLPWLELKPGPGALPDNFAALDAQRWQAHLYGDPPHGIAAACEKHGLTLYRFAWDPLMGQAGLAPGALYLLRPDGYVAFADPHPTAAGLERYITSRSLDPSAR